jgi:signal peptidase I
VHLTAWGVFLPRRLRQAIVRRPATAVHEPIPSLALYRAPAPRRRLVHLALFVLALVLVRGTLFDVYRVPSGSMRPTLAAGDRILVNHLAYGLRIPLAGRPLATWGGPDRGDVVVFRSPADGRSTVKRVVGLPGDRIGPLTVPAGQYFVIGDDRDRSIDSRRYGCVDGRNIVGRVVGVCRAKTG